MSPKTVRESNIRSLPISPILSMFFYDYKKQTLLRKIAHPANYQLK